MQVWGTCGRPGEKLGPGNKADDEQPCGSTLQPGSCPKVRAWWRTGEGGRVFGAVGWVSPGDGGKGVEIESAASQVMQIISFNLLLKITQSQVKEGLYGLSHCYCQGVTALGWI